MEARRLCDLHPASRRRRTRDSVAALVDVLRATPTRTAMTREIVLDTETTGLNPLGGDRVVEIGGVELVNHIPTGRHFHKYVNPERQMTEDAFRVHGLSDEFLRDKPRFADVADEMQVFFGEATLIAHNAPFDMQFLNFELEKVRRPALANTDHRHRAAGPRKASGRPRQPRRALQALRHRQFPPDAARRPARQRDPRRRLSRADRRPPGGAGAGRRRAGRRQPAGPGRPATPPRSGRCRCRRGSTPKRWQRI